MEIKSNLMNFNVKKEGQNKFIDIDQELDKYELLSLLFHKETIKIDTSKEINIIKNDRKRYFEDTTICYNCGEIGHVSRDCSAIIQRNCMYCDTYHPKKPCDFLLCENCLYLGHNTRNCRFKLFEVGICKLCPEQYHYNVECPNVWRKYIFKKAKPRNREIILSCPFCHSESHFMDDCKMKDRKCSIFTKKYREIYYNNKKHKSN